MPNKIQKDNPKNDIKTNEYKDESLVNIDTYIGRSLGRILDTRGSTNTKYSVYEDPKGERRKLLSVNHDVEMTGFNDGKNIIAKSGDHIDITDLGAKGNDGISVVPAERIWDYKFVKCYNDEMNIPSSRGELVSTQADASVAVMDYINKEKETAKVVHQQHSPSGVNVSVASSQHNNSPYVSASSDIKTLDGLDIGSIESVGSQMQDSNQLD